MVNYNYPGSLWWDTLLDGKVHEVDVREDRRFQHLGALRAACYREAEIRHLIARTHKVNPFVMRVQATGLAERDKFIGMPQVNLRQATDAIPAPRPAPPVSEPAAVVDAYDADQDERDNCTCGTTDRRHLPSCRVWG